jgi:hypothetical protein
MQPQGHEEILESPGRPVSRAAAHDHYQRAEGRPNAHGVARDPARQRWDCSIFEQGPQKEMRVFLDQPGIGVAPVIGETCVFSWRRGPESNR